MIFHKRQFIKLCLCCCYRVGFPINGALFCAYDVISCSSAIFLKLLQRITDNPDRIATIMPDAVSIIEFTLFRMRIL